jgi:hypothetical protein
MQDLLRGLALFKERLLNMEWLLYLLCPLMMVVCMIGLFKGDKKEKSPNPVENNQNLDKLKLQMEDLVEQNKSLAKEVMEIKSSNSSSTVLKSNQKSG